MSGGRPPVRVYVPGVWGQLVPRGEITTGSIGHAVTQAVRDADPAGDMDDWEFAAFSDAALASFELLAARTEPVVARRVVVSVDLDPSDVADLGDGSVSVPDRIDVADLACVHVDGRDAEAVVRDAMMSGSAALLDDVALEWFHPSELGALLSSA